MDGQGHSSVTYKNAPNFLAMNTHYEVNVFLVIGTKVVGATSNEGFLVCVVFIIVFKIIVVIAVQYLFLTYCSLYAVVHMHDVVICICLELAFGE